VRDDLVAVVVLEERIDDGVVRQVLANRKTRRVVSGLSLDTLEARPAEVPEDAVGRIVNRVDLLPVVPSHIPDPDLVRAGAKRETEWISEAVCDHTPCVGIRVASERIR